MNWKRKNQVTTALFIAGIVLLLALALATVGFGLRAIASNQRLDSLRHDYRLAHGILQGMVDAETGVRGFLITNDPTYLEPYHSGIERIARLLGDAHAESLLVTMTSGQGRTLPELIAERQKVMMDLIDVMHRQGITAAQKVLSAGDGRRLTDEARGLIAVIDLRLDNDAARIGADVEISARLLSVLLAGSMVLAIILSSAQFWLFRREIQQRGVAEIGQQAQHRQIALLSRMADSLHASNSRDESYHVIEAFASDVLRGTTGCLYVYNHSRDQLVLAARWGSQAQDTDAGRWPEHFQPDDCWGLRRGKLHLGSAVTGHIAGHIDCVHVRAQPPRPSLCLPITARGQSSGLLYLESETLLSSAESRETVELATHFADQLSLALVNIELRERLQNMAIRDPLTELYNRRFMDEALAREILIAQRQGTSLCVAMMDLDHFKKMNDSFGHPAGDEVLKQVAHYLNNSVRRSDFVCRYGGEELMLLLPNCDLAQGIAKADEIRQGIHLLSLVAGGMQLPPVTISIGVAACPQHGQTAGDLLASADQALYEAKRAGRNRVKAGMEIPAENRHAAAK